MNARAYCQPDEKEFAGVKSRLDQWAVFRRSNGEWLGIPRENTIHRLMKYGAGASHQSRPSVLLEPNLPPDIQRTEDLLLAVATINLGWFNAVRLSHLERKSDKTLATMVGVGVQAFRQWRRIGYACMEMGLRDIKN